MRSQRAGSSRVGSPAVSCRVVPSDRGAGGHRPLHHDVEDDAAGRQRRVAGRRRGRAEVGAAAGRSSTRARSGAPPLSVASGVSSPPESPQDRRTWSWPTGSGAPLWVWASRSSSPRQLSTGASPFGSCPGRPADAVERRRRPGARGGKKIAEPPRSTNARIGSAASPSGSGACQSSSATWSQSTPRELVRRDHLGRARDAPGRARSTAASCERPGRRGVLGHDDRLPRHRLARRRTRSRCRPGWRRPGSTPGPSPAPCPSPAGCGGPSARPRPRPARRRPRTAPRRSRTGPGPSPARRRRPRAPA